MFFPVNYLFEPHIEFIFYNEKIFSWKIFSNVEIEHNIAKLIVYFY